MKRILVSLGAAASFAAITGLVGCGADPKAATNSNFAAAIQKYMDAQSPQCFMHVTQEFPFTVDVVDEDGGASNPYHAQLNGLARAGVLTEKEVGTKTIQGLFGKPATAKVRARSLSYDLTAEGRSSFRAPDKAKRGFGASAGDFCFGKQKVVSVDQFTEPADAFGMKMSRINYSYRVDDLPSWAGHEAVIAALPELKKAVESSKKPINAKVAVILTNQGWVHEKGLK